MGCSCNFPSAFGNTSDTCTRSPAGFTGTHRTPSAPCTNREAGVPGWAPNNNSAVWMCTGRASRATMDSCSFVPFVQATSSSSPLCRHTVAFTSMDRASILSRIPGSFSLRNASTVAGASFQSAGLRALSAANIPITPKVIRIRAIRIRFMVYLRPTSTGSG